MTSNIRQLVERTVDAHVERGAKVIGTESRVLATRPPPNHDILLHDVRFQAVDNHGGAVRLVTKFAPLAERKLQAWLDERNLPVPFGHSLNLSDDKLAPLCLQYIPDSAGSVKEAARSLARIHAAAMGKAADFALIPHADVAFFSDFIVDRCWRKPWYSTLENGDFVDAYGHRTLPGPPGDFRARFGANTGLLEDAAARFLQATSDLWDEGDCLTLVHGDFHDEHARFDQGRAYIIDWGQARYGPLYVDLPNYFSRDDALLYRDALAEFGHDIPKDEFLARYDAVRPYPGFKYFSIGLWNWRYGSPPFQDARVQHFVDMLL